MVPVDHEGEGQETRAAGPSGNGDPERQPGSVSPRQRHLLGTPRWGWLGPFIERWFADPLQSGDGCELWEIRAAAERVGAAVPVALVEWFELVGCRLEPVQDQPATPSRLRAVQGRPVVWTENQGVWSILATSDGEDPPCVLDDPTAGAWAETPLSVAVQAMLASDTLVGVWSDTGRGPLGRLNPSVRGGALVDVTDDEVDRLFSIYEPLPLPANPFYYSAVRGDADTLLRGSLDWGMGIEWATATPAAYERFAGMVDLDPPGGEHELLLMLDRLGWADRRFLLNPDGSPRLEPFQAALAGGLGHLGQARTQRGQSIEYRVTTTRPAEAADALLAVLPRRLRGKVTVKERPARLADYRTLQPGRSE